MDCLVTKLKGTVNDSSLPELGCLYFTLQNPSGKLVKIEAIGEDVEFFTPNEEAVFYSSSSKKGSGASKYAVTTSNTIFYVDASTKVRIGVRNKYALEKIDVYESGAKVLAMEIDFADLAYCKKLNKLMLTQMQLSGDISALQNLTALTTIGLYITQLSGDISALQNLTALTTIDLSSTQVSGDISALQNLTALTYISLYSTQVSGDISALQNLTALTYISLYSTNVTGSLDSIANLPSELTFDMGNNTLTGDYFKFLNEHTNSDIVCSGNFNYTTKSWSGKSYRRVGGTNFVCTNLDNFLNDFQVVTVSSTNSNVSPSIKMQGTRTSASDAAVAILQEKGFTISITKA